MITLIAGLVALDGSAPEEARVRAMLAAMNPLDRPAETRIASAGPACLGAVQIAAAGRTPAPPTVLADGQDLFVADLRLWDADALGADAVDPVGMLREVVRRQGAEASARVHGDFAWARWQGGVLALARDHFGARPLVYAVRPGRWAAFASHPGALLAAGLARSRLDLASAMNYPVLNCPLSGRSYQADIATQRPAHLTRIGPDGRVETRRYWRLPIGPRLSEKTDPAEVAAEVRRLLEQAVRRRLPARGPVGAHLSGGIDSTPLAVIAAREIRAAGRSLVGYSFEESGDDLGFELVDEAPYVAEVVAAEPNIRHVAVSEPSFVTALLGPYDAPLLEPADETEHHVAAHAEAAGIDTILSGWGGDQVVSFHASYPAAELFRYGRFRLALAELRRYQARLPVAFYYQVVLPLLPDPWRSRLVRLTGRGTPPGPRLLPAFHPRGSAGPAALEAPIPPEGLSFASRREMSERNFIQHRLARFAWIGAPHGIRYVYPLLDLDLVAYAMRVPAWFLLRDGVPRRLLRDAIKGLVPERLRLRRAKLFPHSRDTLRMPALREEIDRRLAAIPAEGLAAMAVDLAALRAALTRDTGTPEETLEQMRVAAARGEQLYIKSFDYVAPLQLALALDAYEKAYGLAAAAPTDQA